MSEPLQQWQCTMDPKSRVSAKPGSAGRVWVVFEYGPTVGVSVRLSNDDALAFGAAVVLAARDAEAAKEAKDLPDPTNPWIRRMKAATEAAKEKSNG